MRVFRRWHIGRDGDRGGEAGGSPGALAVSAWAAPGRQRADRMAISRAAPLRPGAPQADYRSHDSLPTCGGAWVTGCPASAARVRWSAIHGISALRAAGESLRNRG